MDLGKARTAENGLFHNRQWLTGRSITVKEPCRFCVPLQTLFHYHKHSYRSHFSVKVLEERFYEAVILNSEPASAGEITEIY
jgi:hypothetical protein